MRAKEGSGSAKGSITIENMTGASSHDISEVIGGADSPISHEGPKSMKQKKKARALHEKIAIGRAMTFSRRLRRLLLLLVESIIPSPATTVKTGGPCRYTPIVCLCICVCVFFVCFLTLVA